MQLVYMGFTQEASLRCFHFQRVLTQSRLTNIPRIVQFTLKADMSLFMQHHIPVQEGPAICLQILTDTLVGSDENEIASTSYAVTTEHLSTFVSARTTIAEAKAARRKPRPPFKPSSSSQLKLPPRMN
jgi:pyrroloquinoline quinone (PQQ) biosynthesis protein C